MTEKTWFREADVVVIGYGAAGAAAAIEAHDAGARALILEKMFGPGGNTVLSGGVVYGANTSIQREKGIRDSAEEMTEYVLAASQGLVDKDLVRYTCSRSGENVDWLIALGVKFEPNPNTHSFEDQPEYTARFALRPRVHRPLEGGGWGLMRPLIKAVDDRGIEVMFRTPMQRLITHPRTKEVIGVKTDKGDIRARKAVVLATGGFGQNQDMVRNYLSAHKGVINMGSAGIAGDGIRAGHALGADLLSMGLIEGLLSGVVSGRSASSGDERVVRVPYITNNRLAPCILVNKQSKRFVDEYLHYALMGPKIERELEDQTCFCIFDEATRRAYGERLLRPKSSPGLVREIESGMVVAAPTVEELALKLGLEANVLRETVSIFNRNAEMGIDPEFGRKLHLVPVRESPFCAMRYKPTYMHTNGGLKVNTKAQVMDVFGDVIPRLYAVGETTGGHVGRHYPSSGYMLMHCFAMGRTAGRTAAGEPDWPD